MQKIGFEDFFISVKYNKRAYHYKVVHQRVNCEQEVFLIISDHKTVVVESTWHLLSRDGLKVSKRNYSYDKNAITNKGLMKKIISLIDQLMGTSFSDMKTSSAIAI